MHFPAQGFKRKVVSESDGLLYHFRLNDFTKGEASVEDFIMLKYFRSVMQNSAMKLCS